MGRKEEAYQTLFQSAQRVTEAMAAADYRHNKAEQDRTGDASARAAFLPVGACGPPARPPAQGALYLPGCSRQRPLASAAVVWQRHRAMRVIKVWESRFISDVLPSGRTG